MSNECAAEQDGETRRMAEEQQSARLVELFDEMEDLYRELFFNGGGDRAARWRRVLVIRTEIAAMVK